MSDIEFYLTCGILSGLLGALLDLCEDPDVRAAMIAVVKVAAMTAAVVAMFVWL